MENQFLKRSEFENFKRTFLILASRVLERSKRQKRQFIKTSEVSQLLGCSRSTVNVLRSKKILRATRIGNNWYYDVDEVENLRNKGLSS